MEKDKICKVIDSLDKTNSFSHDIESNIQKINETISNLPVSVIDSFKIYTEPQQNIQEINKFYRQFIFVIEESNRYKIRNKKNHVEMIDNYYKTKELLDSLNEYTDIKIVQRYVNKSLKSLQHIVEPLNNLFFKHFVKNKSYNRDRSVKEIQNTSEIAIQKSDKTDEQKTNNNEDQKPDNKINEQKVDNENDLIKISHFLEQENEKNYIQQFCKVLIDKYKCKQNSEFIEHLRLLNNDFIEIKNTCNVMLSEKHAENVNLQVKQMIVIEAKNILSRILLNYENKYKNENLYSCCKLYIYLNKEEVKQYFVEFFDNITKIIYNLLLTFFCNIEEIRRPNKEHKSEEIILLTYKIIKCFENDCFCDFFAKYKNDLEYKNYEELKTYSGKILTEKMYQLSQKLKGIQKNVYILNNLYIIQFFYKVHDQVPLVENIENHSNEIISIWENESRKRKESDFTKFLDVNLEIQKDFYLPEEIRINIVEKIKENLLEICKEKNTRKVKKY